MAEETKIITLDNLSRFKTKLDEKLAGKQNTLTAGVGISITDNIIAQALPEYIADEFNIGVDQPSWHMIDSEAERLLAEMPTTIKIIAENIGGSFTFTKIMEVPGMGCAYQTFAEDSSMVITLASQDSSFAFQLMETKFVTESALDTISDRLTELEPYACRGQNVVLTSSSFSFSLSGNDMQDIIDNRPITIVLDLGYSGEFLTFHRGERLSGKEVRYHTIVSTNDINAILTFYIKTGEADTVETSIIPLGTPAVSGE